jgi:hypothetical protein
MDGIFDQDFNDDMNEESLRNLKNKKIYSNIKELMDMSKYSEVNNEMKNILSNQ